MCPLSGEGARKGSVARVSTHHQCSQCQSQKGKENTWTDIEVVDGVWTDSRLASRVTHHNRPDPETQPSRQDPY